MGWFSNLGSGDITSGLSSFMSKLTFWTRTAVIIALIGVIGVMMYYFLLYNIKVEIYQKRGGNIIKTISDRARRVKKKGGYIEYKLLKGRTSLKPPEDYSVIYQTRFGKDKLKLYKRTDKDFEYITFDAKDGQFEPTPLDISFWLLLKQEEINSKYTKTQFWDRYGGLIIQIGAILLVVIFTLLITQKLDLIAEKFGGIAEQLGRINVQPNLPMPMTPPPG